MATRKVSVSGFSTGSGSEMATGASSATAKARELDGLAPLMVTLMVTAKARASAEKKYHAKRRREYI